MLTHTDVALCYKVLQLICNNVFWQGKISFESTVQYNIWGLIIKLLEELIHTLQILIIMQYVTGSQICYALHKVIKLIADCWVSFFPIFKVLSVPNIMFAARVSYTNLSKFLMV